MRRFVFALLLPLILFLAGCDMPQRADSSVPRGAETGVLQRPGPNVPQSAETSTPQETEPNAPQSSASGISQSADSDGASLSESPAYHSDTSPEDCFLGGNGMENRMPPKWGQNNIALISLNTFEIKPVEINRYDGD